MQKQKRQIWQTLRDKRRACIILCYYNTTNQKQIFKVEFVCNTGHTVIELFETTFRDRKLRMGFINVCKLQSIYSGFNNLNHSIYSLLATIKCIYVYAVNVRKL